MFTSDLDRYAGLLAGATASSLGLGLLLVGNGLNHVRIWLGAAVLAALLGGSLIAFQFLQAPISGSVLALLALVWTVGWLLRSRRATESIIRRLGNPSFQTVCLFLAAISVSAAWHRLIASQGVPEINAAEERQGPMKRDQVGEARTDQGTRIALYRREYLEATAVTPQHSDRREHMEAFQSIQTGEGGLMCNCHGWIFTQGHYWVDCESIPTILHDNGYQVVSEPQPGDLIVYRDNDKASHTGVVQAVTSEKLVLIESKWGSGARFVHAAQDQPYSMRWDYYRSSRKGHLLQGIDTQRYRPGDDAPANSPAA